MFLEQNPKIFRAASARVQRGGRSIRELFFFFFMDHYLLLLLFGVQTPFSNDPTAWINMDQLGS